MQLDKHLLKEWSGIISTVDKTDIPLECINKITLKLSNRRQKTLNLLKLKNQGLDLDEIEEIFKEFLEQHYNEIQDVNFVVDIETVASIIQPETDKILNGL